MFLTPNFARGPFGVLVPGILYSTPLWMVFGPHISPPLERFDTANTLNRVNTLVTPLVHRMCMQGEHRVENMFCSAPGNYTIPSTPFLGLATGSLPTQHTAVTPGLIRQLIMILMMMTFDLLTLVAPDLFALCANYFVLRAVRLWNAMTKNTFTILEGKVGHALGLSINEGRISMGLNAFMGAFLVLPTITCLIGACYLHSMVFLVCCALQWIAASIPVTTKELTKAVVYMSIGGLTLLVPYFASTDSPSETPKPVISSVKSTPKKTVPIKLVHKKLPVRPSRSENNLAYIAAKNEMLLEAGAKPIPLQTTTNETPIKNMKTTYTSPCVTPSFRLTIATPPRRADGSLIIPNTPPSAPPTPHQLGQSPIKPSRSAEDDISMTTMLDSKLKEFAEEGNYEDLEVLRDHMKEGDVLEPVAKKLTFGH